MAGFGGRAGKGFSAGQGKAALGGGRVNIKRVANDDANALVRDRKPGQLAKSISFKESNRVRGAKGGLLQP